jgi:LPS-assembly protein
MLRWLLAASLAGLTLFGGVAQAQKAPQSAPLLFSADEVQTDEDLGLVVAKGHVQISQDQQTLLADTVTYNRRSDTITASGHVSLQQPTGEIFFADFMELRDRFQEGFMQDIRVLLSDRSRLAGNAGRRTGGERLELRRGVYSPCDLCREDPTRPPIWQMRAETIVHDKESHTIEYRDAVLELGGIPVLYTPYFSHADPTVKRQSGFLAPTFGDSSTLGGHATLPYYWAIAKDRDVTFTPIITTSEGAVADTDYRQRFSNGAIDIEGSINNGLTPDVPARDTIRSHLRAAGQWNLDETWRTGFDLQRASDQTYERLFHFGGTENFLTSRGFAEAFTPRSFLGIDAYSFQTLRQFTSDSTQPLVAPVVNYNWLGEPDALGGRLSADANLLDLNRSRGTGSHRLSLGTAWTKPFKGLIGDVFTFTASTRGDVYNATDLRFVPTDPARDANTGRVFPQLSLQWQYPWVRRDTSSSQVIEPVVSFIAGPNGSNPATIPNEDSLAFDFNDTDLFVPNRFAGLDRVDSGDRVDYGLRAAIYGNGLSSTSKVSMLIGQSYRLQNTGGFAAGSGIEHQQSDIVGRFIVSPNDLLDAVYRYRLSKDDFTLQRQEVGVAGGPTKLRLSLNYIKLPPDLLSTDTGTREQISVGATIGLSRYWTVSAATTNNLTGQVGTVSSSIAATYQDDCLGFITTLAQSGTRDRDVRPGASLVFSLVFKNLGEVALPAFATAGISGIQ